MKNCIKDHIFTQYFGSDLISNSKHDRSHQLFIIRVDNTWLKPLFPKQISSLLKKHQKITLSVLSHLILSRRESRRDPSAVTRTSLPLAWPNFYTNSAVVGLKKCSNGRG